MNYKNAGQDAELDADDFRRVAQFALVTAAAVNALKEVNTTPNHAERVAYAREVVNGNVAMTPVLYVLLTDPELQSMSRAKTGSDAQIQAAVNSLFNVLAGVGT